jgi:voltage-gated potassium channel
MMKTPYRKFIWSGVALACLLLVGAVGYRLLSGGTYSFIDTLYMTVITVTTIGFSEVVDLSNNPGGRVFTMFIAFSGIGIMGYVATNLTVLLVEGQLTDSFRRRRMENIAKHSSGHYIICGVGKLGAHIIRELVHSGRKIVIVERDRNKLARALAADKNAVFIEGSATDNETLGRASIDSAAGLFAVTGDDNLNLVITLSARQLNPTLRIVSECNDVANEDKMKKTGADSVVSPSFIGGMRMASEMVRPTVTSFLDIMLRDYDKNLRVEEIRVPEGYPETDLPHSGLKRFAHSLLLAAKDESGWLYNPPDSYKLKPGKVLVFMTTPEGKKELEALLQSGKTFG